MCFYFLEFERFVRFQNEWRRQLMSSEDEKNGLRSSVKELEKLNRALETKLKHARNQIDNEIRKRKLVEQERQHLVFNGLRYTENGVDWYFVFMFRSNKSHLFEKCCWTKVAMGSWTSEIASGWSSSIQIIRCQTLTLRSGNIYQARQAI